MTDFMRCWKYEPEADGFRQCGRFLNLSLVQTIEVVREAVDAGERWHALAIIQPGGEFLPRVAAKLVMGAPDEETLLDVLRQILAPASPIATAIATAIEHAEVVHDPFKPPNEN